MGLNSVQPLRKGDLKNSLFKEDFFSKLMVIFDILNSILKG